MRALPPQNNRVGATMPVRLLLLVLGLAAASAASAGVPQISANGFLSRNTVMVRVGPAEAFAALLLHLPQWWDPKHTYSGDSHNLSIEPRAGGCFCEHLPKGGGVAHMTVVNLQPPSLLRMTGALGPLQAQGLTGSLTWKFSTVAGGTQIELTYSVGGYSAEGFGALAPAVDSVLHEQLHRLAAYAEQGLPKH